MLLDAEFKAIPAVIFSAFFPFIPNPFLNKLTISYDQWLQKNAIYNLYTTTCNIKVNKKLTNKL